jgi:hypothetical protein
MRKRRTLVALLVLVGIGALFVAPSAYSLGKAALKNVSDVFVTNDASNPVPASIVGQPSVSVANSPTVTIAGQPSVSVANSPTVTIAGTPAVQVVETPFQEFVVAETSGGESCQSVAVPDGKTLTITSFNADVSAEANRQPDVYLLTTVHQPNGANFVRALRLVLHQANANAWSGDVQTTLYSGNANDPSGVTFSYSACISAFDSQGSFSASFRGFVSGTLS